MKRICKIVFLAIGAVALACIDRAPIEPDTVDDTETTTPLPGIVVSNAQTPIIRASSGVSIAAASSAIAYVSAEPKSLANAFSVTLRNVTRIANAVSARVINGGFDPLGISAEAGDELALSISNLDGTSTNVAIKVPARRPPRVVRTNPSKGRIDVALTIQIEAIFTEPVDKSTVTTSSIRLLRDGNAVPGTATLSDDGLSATFTPTDPLAFSTTYTFNVGADVRDLDGDGLSEPSVVEFTTVKMNSAEVPNGPVSGAGIAFVRDGTIYVNGDTQTAPVPLVLEALHPAWSPDGKQMAYTRPAKNVIEQWQLCVSQANGDNERCASGANGVVAGTPSWSPDGAKLAFSYFGFGGPSGGSYSGLLLLNVSTMTVESVNTPPVHSASWSPDGHQIALAMAKAGNFGRGALAIVNADGSGFKIVAMSLGAYSVRDVTWSPIGDLLAVTMNDETACPWYCDTAIGITDTSGNLVKIFDRVHTCFQFSCTDDSYIWGAPAWSSDGSHVAYTVTRSDSCWEDERVTCGTDVVLANVNDGKIGQLIPAAGLPSWRH